EAIEKLSNMTVEIVQAYTSTSLEAVSVYIEEGLDDPFENEDALIESLNYLGQIAHKKYQASGAVITQLFDPITTQYQDLINSFSMMSPDEFKEALEVIETKFAWLIYTMASFVGNRASFTTSDNVDEMDSEITTRVLQLVNVQQTLQNQHGNTFMNEKLDLAFIYFFQQFKKSYMSESNGRNIYANLTKVFGIRNQIEMLEVIMRKIVSNLQLWADNELIVRRTLELFGYLNTGYGASKNLRKLETTNMILQNHLSSEMTFFQYEKQSENRIIYFQTLCKLLFADDNITERIFYEFMKPFDMRIQLLGPLDTIESFRQEKNRLLKQADVPADQAYDYKYEGISLCFNIMDKCLGGKYINFGILWLYQDKAVNDAFEATLKLVESIPLYDLLSFPKLAHSFFNMLDEFVKEQQLMAMPAISPKLFLYLLQACEQGIMSMDPVVFSHACSAINHICCYIIQETEKANRQQKRRRPSQPHWIVSYLGQFRHILPTLLESMFQQLLFDEKSDQWSLSRPLYPLIILERDYVFKYIAAVVENQLPERRSIVTTILNGLLDGINYTLSTRDRERFTHNVSAFRKPLKAHSIKLVPLAESPAYY
ncbi:Exportin 7, partial [Rhizopus stolonifer]